MATTATISLITCHAAWKKFFNASSPVLMPFHTASKTGTTDDVNQFATASAASFIPFHTDTKKSRTAPKIVVTALRNPSHLFHSRTMTAMNAMIAIPMRMNGLIDITAFSAPCAVVKIPTADALAV